MAKHTWKFARIGGFDQVVIATGADLAAIGELDQKLWTALACPAAGLEFDKRTLALLDTDKDGRIRAPELIEATKWTASLLADVETLAEGSETLSLDAIDDSTDEGKLLLRTAKELLRSSGRPEAEEISTHELDAALEAFHKQPFNGDGILPAESAPDATLKKVVEDALACTKPETDKSGKLGVTKATVEAFFAEVRAHAAWLAKAEADPALSPLGAESAAAFAAWTAVRAKIEDFFSRAHVAAYDARALPALNGDEKEYVALAAKELSATATELSHWPLAQVQIGHPLPLEQAVNPAWAAKVAELRAKVVKPLLGDRAALTEADFSKLKEKLAPREAWMGEKAGASVEKLGAARVKELAEPGLEAKILALVEEDAAKEPMAKAIEGVEKLAHYQRDLMTLANNFVAFRDFYARDKAIFQAGTLYLDTRACDLCLRVADAGKHATMAPLANTYLVYCDCKNAKGDKLSICAAMTAGDVDNLMVGRNGVFYDREGKDWDATITKIVDNPISVRQAFWAPYKKVIRLIEEQIAKRAEAAHAESDAKLTSGVQETTAKALSGEAPAEPPKPKKLDIGVVAAIGVGVGGITAAFGAILQGFFGLGYLMPLGVVGLMLAISGPSMAIAWLKLRKRNLGPILDANGWAVNAQAKVNIPLGGSLTGLPKLPKGSSRDLVDPFQEKRRPWWLYITLLVLLGLAAAWYVGKLDKWLPATAKSVTVLGDQAPAYVAPGTPAAAPAAAGTPATTTR